MDSDDPVAPIAAALGERYTAPVAQIRRLIERCGLAQVTTWLTRTQEIEAGEGMLRHNGKRRRTPGGTFFYLVKGEIAEPEVRKYVFGRSSVPKPPATPPPSGQAAAPEAPRERWDDRAAWLNTATTGKATTVKVTIIGKPGKPVERQGFTLVRMIHTPKLDAMPKGLPIPTKVPETPYVLYIGAKQWRKVADALKNPEDVLICEGVQTWDAQYQVLTVFVTTCTTKLLQQAQRPTPPPAKA